MGIQYDNKTDEFQIDYQSPFGGIDSTAYASAIDPKNFPSMDAIFIEDNVIKPIALSQFGPTSNILGHYLGFIPLLSNTSSVFGYIITDTNYYQVSYVGGTLFVINSGTYAPAASGTSAGFNYIVIASVQSAQPQLYWTTGGWHEIWTAPTFSLTNPSLLTNYVGGGILALLNNQLLNLGGVSSLDGPVPNRISWSAPGQYGQFVPYNVGTGTGNFAAGFNDLPSVSDVITWFAAIGTVGYLGRTEGITQMNPTGNGEEPFQFNHLWASEVGIGSPYPKSVSQYGSIVAFIADGVIYTLGLSGLNEIGGQARTFNFKVLNNQFLQAGVQGRIVPYLVNSPELFYVFAIPADNFVEAWQFIAIKLSDGTTYNLGLFANLIGNTQVVTMSVISNVIFSATGTFTRQIIPLVVTSNGSQVSFYIFKTLFSQVGQIAFRKEQLKFGFTPTVQKVGLLASLIDITQPGLIKVSIDGGNNFGQTTVGGVTTGFNSIVIPTGFLSDTIATYFSDGVTSLERPQLVLQLTNVQVVEAWYQGTLAEFELI